jgi:transketolase
MIKTQVETMADSLNISQLKEIARQMRIDIISMTTAAGSGHPSSSLSMVEILTLLYFGGVLRYNPANPQWADRDRLILSKGHAVPGLYAALGAAGYFSRDLFPTLRQLGSVLQGHADMSRTPGVEASAGSLGQGLSIGIGHALAARLDKRDSRVYVITGDGEIDEGQNWEAAMSACKYQVDNLCLIVDRNNAQQSGWVKDILPTDPLTDKFRASGWKALDIDGHDLRALTDAFATARATKGQPTVIVAHTIKGKGVTFMEKDFSWHGRAVEKPEQVTEALEEIKRRDIG